jgi:hypothetical protein
VIDIKVMCDRHQGGCVIDIKVMCDRQQGCCVTGNKADV